MKVSDVIGKVYKPYTLQDVYDCESEKRFTVVSFFSGMGGSSTGYRLAGGNVLGANEFMEVARKIYHKNYPHTHIFPNDIRTLQPEDILSTLDIEKGELDILDGSPPCASFSTQGMREKAWGKEKNYSKTTQRVDDLFYQFVRMVDGLQPKCFIAENVKGLQIGDAKKILGSKTRGLEHFGEGFDEKERIVDEDDNILDTLRKCGYVVSYKLIKFYEHGVPQKRERVILFGVRRDLSEKHGLKPTFPKPFTNENHPIAKDFISEFLFDGSQFNLKPETKTSINLSYLPPHAGAGVCSNTFKANGIKTFESKFHRNNWFEPYMTILASFGGNEFHSVIHRFSNIFEGMRAQTFPDNLHLFMNETRRVKLSLNEIIKLSNNQREEFKFANHQAGCLTAEQAGKILKDAGMGDIDWDDRIFSIHLTAKNTEDFYMGTKNAYEFVGRAVPPWGMAQIANHVYENYIRIFNEK